MLTIAKRTRKIHDIHSSSFLRNSSTQRFPHRREVRGTHCPAADASSSISSRLLYYCGTRIGEALQIEWSQVNLDERTIRLEEEQTKTGEARVLPLPPSLVMMLAEVEPKVGESVRWNENLRKERTKACVAASRGTLTEV